MCTAVCVNGRYFGRNLDVENSYGETVAIMPKNYDITYSNGKKIKSFDNVRTTFFSQYRLTPLCFDDIMILHKRSMRCNNGA